jgi:hypothetical protein
MPNKHANALALCGPARTRLQDDSPIPRNPPLVLLLQPASAGEGFLTGMRRITQSRLTDATIYMVTSTVSSMLPRRDATLVRRTLIYESGIVLLERNQPLAALLMFRPALQPLLSGQAGEVFVKSQAER